MSFVIGIISGGLILSIIIVLFGNKILKEIKGFFEMFK